MILNRARETVRQWVAGTSSNCPDCGSPLIARRGDRVVWHWAHHPGSVRRSDCQGGESLWHLACKDAYLSFANWEIELAVTANGRKYRLDAASPRTREVREFVHSLAGSYVQKHADLTAAGWRVRWMLDGAALGSLRSRDQHDGSLRGLLKPAAYELASKLKDSGAVVWCHHRRLVWTEWKGNRWYERPSPPALVHINATLDRFKARAAAA